MGLIPLGFWAASAASNGASAAYELISTTVLGSAAASVTFSGLGTSAAAYKHLQIRAVARGDAASNYIDSRIRFNGDTAGNYSFHEIYGYPTGIASGNGVSQTNMAAAYFAAASSTANNFGTMISDILDFQSVTKNKTIKSLSGINEGASSLIDIRSGAWLSTAAITSITVFPTSGNFVTGSRFSLYGLR